MGYVREAARVIEDAERPVIVAGGGAMASSAGPEIVKLAEMLSIPVATSLNGKGTIVETHALSLGAVGSYSRWCANQVVSEADLVIFIGSHTGDQVTNSWTVPRPGTPVIQIDIDPIELGRSYPNRVGLMADAKVSVLRLIENIDRRYTKNDWAQRAQQWVQKWREEIEPFRNSNAIPILPERLCKEITESLHLTPSSSQIRALQAFGQGPWCISPIQINCRFGLLVLWVGHSPLLWEQRMLSLKGPWSVLQEMEGSGTIWPSLRRHAAEI